MRYDPERLDIVNDVLQTFAPESHLSYRRGWCVTWGNKRRRWQIQKGSSFYPIWLRHWPYGGTSAIAMSQLIFWLRDQPVLPLSSWRYWASDTCKLLPSSAVDLLHQGGYPEHANCVLCGEVIAGGLDWWNLDGVSGPCCGWTTGCRQKCAIRSDGV